MVAMRAVPLHEMGRDIRESVSVSFRSRLEYPTGLWRRVVEEIHPGDPILEARESVDVECRAGLAGVERHIKVLLGFEVTHDHAIRDALRGGPAAVAEARLDHPRAVQPDVFHEVVVRGRVHLARDDSRGACMNRDGEAEVADSRKEVDDRLPTHSDSSDPHS